MTAPSTTSQRVPDSTTNPAPTNSARNGRLRACLTLGFFALVAIALAGGLLLSRNLAARPSQTEASSAGCSACFAAEIASPAQPARGVVASPLEDYGSVVLYKPETWDTVSRQNVEDALALLPATVRSELGNPDLGPVFVTVNKDGSLISGKRPYGRAANFFSTSEDTNQVVLYPDQPVRVILHELGHAYNLRKTPGGSYGQAYLSPELQDFMSAVSWRVLTPPDKLIGLRNQADVAVVLDGPSPWTDLSHEDPLEDFANSFALFFAAPQQLQHLSPARYEWFAGHFAL